MIPFIESLVGILLMGTGVWKNAFILFIIGAFIFSLVFARVRTHL
jgi:hypothetical protein